MVFGLSLFGANWAYAEPSGPPSAVQKATGSSDVAPTGRTCTSAWGYHINHGPEDGTTKYLFDSAGRPLGSTTTSQRCALAVMSGSGCTEFKTSVTLAYENGQLESATAIDENGTKHVTNFSFDSKGRLSTRSRVGAYSRPEVESFTYDSKGLLSKRTVDRDGNGKPDVTDTFDIAYDTAGRIRQFKQSRVTQKINKHRPDGGLAQRITKFTYDAHGQLASSETVIKNISVDFDRKRDAFSTHQETFRYVTSYQVDALGRIERMKTCVGNDEPCTTTELTRAVTGKPDARTTQDTSVQVTEQFGGECHLEELSLVEKYLIASPLLTFSNDINVRTDARWDGRDPYDDWAFRLVVGRSPVASTSPPSP